MIPGLKGAHWLFYSKDPEGDRAFLRDIVGLHSIDVGGGWLIFALPPSEVAVHPGDGGMVQEHAGSKLAGAVLYLMCEDVHQAVQSLEARGVHCAPLTEAEWGIVTGFPLPSGGEIGLYQPKHERPV